MLFSRGSTRRKSSLFISVFKDLSFFPVSGTIYFASEVQSSLASGKASFMKLGKIQGMTLQRVCNDHESIIIARSGCLRMAPAVRSSTCSRLNLVTWPKYSIQFVEKRYSYDLSVTLSSWRRRSTDPICLIVFSDFSRVLPSILSKE